MTLRLRALLRLLAVAAMAAVLTAAVASWVQVGLTISDAKPTGSVFAPTAIVWANRVFQSEAQLARWLRSRGARYDSWRRTHRYGSAIVEHRPLPAAPGKPARSVERAPASQPSQRTAASGSTSQGSPFRYALLVALLAVAAALAWGAALPGPFRRRFPRITERLWPHRDVFAAGAAAVVIGALIGVGLA